MDLNNLFEDLETQFEAEFASRAGSSSSTSQSQLTALKLPPTGPILVELQLNDGLKFRLIAATLGLNFIAGVEVGSSTAVAISNQCIAQIQLHPVSASKSYELKITGREFIEFCSVFIDQKSLVKIHFSNHDQQIKHGWITGQFLNLFEFVDRNGRARVYLPACSISRIEALPVHN